MFLKYRPYTHSRIQNYKNCPRQFYYDQVQKLPKEFKPSVALDRGTLIHLIFEHHKDLTKIKTSRDFKQIIERKLLSKEQIKECFSIYDNFMNSKVGKSLFSRKQLFAEMSLGLTDNLDITAFGKDNFLRGYIDAAVVDEKSDTLIVIDYKTGRYKEQQDFSQLLWYSIGLFSKMPSDKILMVYAFVEHNKINKQVLHRKDIEKYKRALYDTVDKIEIDELWKKNETGLCDWCVFQNYCITDNRLFEEEEIPF